MRAVLVAVVLVACDAGVPVGKPAPPPKPVPVQPGDAALAVPAAPRTIDWQLAGLGSWKGSVIGGVIWHVEIDLEAARIAITDPEGVTKRRALEPDQVRAYARLAKVVREEPLRAPANSCTDRSETLRVDSLVLADSCPIAQPGAGALIAAIERELK